MKRIIALFLVFLVLGTAVIGPQQMRVYTTTPATLSAPGYSAVTYCAGYNRLYWFFTIVSINSVTIAIMAKKGSSAWTNIYANTVTYTANGNYGIEWDKVALADSVKFRFISEVGGTAATITHNVALAGGN